MKKILVTGATGFIGLALCRQLQQSGNYVVGLSRNKPLKDGPWDNFLELDLTCQTLTRDQLVDIEAICHLAAITHDTNPSALDQENYWQLNYHATKKLYMQAAANGVKQFLYISSVKAAGEPGRECINESYPGFPIDVYGITKRKAEDFLLSNNQEEIKVFVIRPALVYGASVKGNILSLVSAIEKKYMPVIAIKSNKRSMVSVDDLVKAMLIVLEKARNRSLYFVTDGHCYSTYQIVETLREAAGQSIGYFRIGHIALFLASTLALLIRVLSFGKINGLKYKVEKLTGSACYSSEKIQRELGWKPADSLEKMAPLIISCYRSDDC